jgi:hypothetical protein
MRQCTQHLSHQFNGSQLNTSQRMMNRIPKFIDSTAWKQAEILMQPALIRVIDKLGKYLENSSWQGNYQTVTLWPEGTSPKIQKKVIRLQTELKKTKGARAAIIAKELNKLPQSYPNYVLSLENGEQRVEVSLWELCYQVCFLEYALDSLEPHPLVRVDTYLLDSQGEVDWERLDKKTEILISNFFHGLPST